MPKNQNDAMTTMPPIMARDTEPMAGSSWIWRRRMRSNIEAMPSQAGISSDATSSFPRIFDLEKVTFRRNRAKLDDDGKAELDEIVKVLQQYPDAQIDVYGYVGDNEKTAYRGSKELTLDDVRARNIYNYLVEKGIDESRMSFAGNGGSSTVQAAIRLRSR